MRLLNVYSLALEEFWDDASTPEYVALSHRWSQDEVTFEDIKQGKSQTATSSWDKLLSLCKTAKGQKYQYVWMDTVCIDRSSSAELSEAINSMYRWYSNAAVCYAYLSDVPDQKGVQRCRDESFEDRFLKSEWFTRGWTLQELLAPQHVKFFGQTWEFLGDKRSLNRPICKITGISEAVLNLQIPVVDIDIKTRISWLRGRETTRVEDLAYSLLGIFDVNMALLYGEGIRALYRLQEEILKVAWPQEMASLASNMMRHLRTSKESKASRIWSSFTGLVSAFDPSIWSKSLPSGGANICSQIPQPSSCSLNLEPTTAAIREPGKISMSSKCSSRSGEMANANCIFQSETQEDRLSVAVRCPRSPENNTCSAWPSSRSGSPVRSNGGFAEPSAKRNNFDPSLPGQNMSGSSAFLDDLSSLLDHAGMNFPVDPLGFTPAPDGLADDVAYSSAAESNIMPVYATSMASPSRDSRFKRAIPSTSQRHAKKIRTYRPRCDNCHRTFTRIRDRQRHLADIHGQASKYYKCYGCEYQSKRKDKVMSHCRHKHGHNAEGHHITCYSTGYHGLIDTPYFFSTACTPWNESSPSTNAEQPSYRSSPTINPVDLEADWFSNWDDVLYNQPLTF